MEKKMYSNTKKKTHNAHVLVAHALLSFLPRPPLSCRLAPSAPRLEQQATLRKSGKNGSKNGLPAPLAWVLAHCPQYTVKRAAPRLHARRQVRCYQALCLLKSGASP